ncbi:MAG: hypothetical protein ACR2MS_04925 [Weeksellaceae bacterium]
MNLNLKRLKDVVKENSITIILNTHRTKPDYEKDKIQLKNLIKETENRLRVKEDKKLVDSLMKRVKDLAEEIDHSFNLESLILFVNEDIAEYVRLPIAVEDRVVIDNTFATRDLVRTLNLESSYFILLLSQQKVRLIEAFNDKLIREVGNPFPYENTDLYPESRAEAAIAGRERNLLLEFYNRVDKYVNEVRKDNRLPVLICADKNNYERYLEIADEKYSIFNFFLNGNRLDQKASNIVKEAWPLVNDYKKRVNDERKADLKQAVSENKFLVDVNDIWRALTHGRIQTLFIEQGKFQPAIIENDSVQFVDHTFEDRKKVIDDIYDEMIEINLDHGGDVVFLPKGDLEKFNGFGAITRF